MCASFVSFIFIFFLLLSFPLFSLFPFPFFLFFSFLFYPVLYGVKVLNIRNGVRKYKKCGYRWQRSVSEFAFKHETDYCHLMLTSVTTLLLFTRTIPDIEHFKPINVAYFKTYTTHTHTHYYNIFIIIDCNKNSLHRYTKTFMFQDYNSPCSGDGR